MNVEFKAVCENPERIRTILRTLNAEYRGMDHQIDTYFRVPHGRLKLREGNIENNLIYYARSNTAGPKRCDYHLCRTESGPPVKALLVAALGILVIVDKQREIYFIENVKIHLDTVARLGCFIEVEAIDSDFSAGEDKLREQCLHYVNLFHILPGNLVENSYSDLLLSATGKGGK
jgi:adenylate cyclase class IV